MKGRAISDNKNVIIWGADFSGPAINPRIKAMNLGYAGMEVETLHMDCDTDLGKSPLQVTMTLLDLVNLPRVMAAAKGGPVHQWVVRKYRRHSEQGDEWHALLDLSVSEGKIEAVSFEMDEDARLGHISVVTTIAHGHLVTHQLDEDGTLHNKTEVTW